jgi:outer membrane receptor protein involved in Fe transport
MFKRAQAMVWLAGSLLAISVSAVAEESVAAKSDVLEEIVIFGRGEQLIGKAAAASEGTVGGADLSVRPLLRVAELLEAVPGLIAAQHSGSGKANQYFLRGFNLDHGTDFTSYVDDVPWNLRTHGHGQGYLDVNGLIPEVVERIDYRKGPYRADTGDFSLAGASFLATIDELKRKFVAVEAGQFGWQRLAGGGTTALGAGKLTTVAQWKTYNGPWQLPENLQHFSGWTKYSQPTGFGTFNASLSGYRASWHPTEQAPERVFGTSVCANEFCALDTTAVGKTDRWIASAQWLANDWHATAYAQYYNWFMFSDPTYDYQIRQFDRRWTAGGRYERTLLKSAVLNLTAGAETRYDHIDSVGVDHTYKTAFVAPISDNAVKEGSAAVYTEATWTPVKPLRITGGLRGNYYDFDVSAKNALSSAGHQHVALATPKLGLAYALNDRVEFYGNWGRGFHSNDARGVVNTTTPVPGLVVGTGYEGGARLEIGSLKISAAYWWLNVSSELIFVGDSNAVEPKGGSKRHGYELVAFWRPLDWLAFDAVYTGSRARYDQAQDDGGVHIEGGVESAGEFGFSAIRGRWETSARLRYLGAYPLLPDNSQRADAEYNVNLRAAYKAKHITLYGEVLNVLNGDDKDIVYYYGTNVPGIDPTPDPGNLDATRVDGRVSRVEEPRTLRVGIKYEY